MGQQTAPSVPGEAHMHMQVDPIPRSSSWFIDAYGSYRKDQSRFHEFLVRVYVCYMRYVSVYIHSVIGVCTCSTLFGVVYMSISVSMRIHEHANNTTPVSNHSIIHPLTPTPPVYEYTHTHTHTYTGGPAWPNGVRHHGIMVP